jgi:Reverse transcriptase (RNA-dependent DNA polymerase)
MIDFYSLAIDNISMHGDTDIFPYPIENALFFDKKKEVKDLLLDIDKNFIKWLASYPVVSIKTCVPSGYNGFRWATMIDPIWNAYLLSEVLKISEQIEMKRIPIEYKSVFSYRIKLDTESGKIFDTEIGWRMFYTTALETIEGYSYAVRFDISDFYNRIYQHRLENALSQNDLNKDVIYRILEILNSISTNVSYGLPIGGNAARILAEILLNSMDQFMMGKNIRFCRFVDDYIVFAQSKEEAYRLLNMCAEFLLKNEGLALQKNKTQIQSKSEFISHAKATLEGEEGDTNKEQASFLKLHIHYDPYSSSAEQDYNDLKEQISQFDIVSLIKSEVRKSKIHQALGKQLLRAVATLEEPKLSLAFNVISSNLEVLYPILPAVMQLAQKKLLQCNESTISLFLSTICSLIVSDSYLLQTDNNASYAARVLSLKNSVNTIQAIEALFSKKTSHLVKTNCIYAMTNLKNFYWLTNVKADFTSLSRWERRAFIAASFFIGDEGNHWRNNTKEQFTSFEILLRDWIAAKHPSQNAWKLPL